jgi:internalin A
MTRALTRGVGAWTGLLWLVAATAGLFVAVGSAAAEDVTFSSSSGIINHAYFALSLTLSDSIGSSYALEGTGLSSGASRTFTLTTSDKVLDVACVALCVRGFGENPAAEQYTYRLAQDTAGNVRILKMTGTNASGDAVSWEAATVNETKVFLPATPTAGQHFEWFDGQTLDVVATGLTVARGANGVGPFYNCVRLRWTGGDAVRDSWVCPSLGVVKEDWTSETGAAGWQRPFAFRALVPDAWLRDRLCDETGKTEATITLADLQALTSLNVSVESTLEGIQLCQQLQTLEILSANMEDRVPDLEIVGTLTNLTDLAIEGIVADLSPLAGLTSLRRLFIEDVMLHGEIASLAPLAGMHDLEELMLNCQQISDLSPLAGLTKLRVLSLWDNLVQDLAPLASLTQLTNLEVSYNNVQSLAPLADLDELVELGLSGNLIQDVTPLAGKEKLTSLSLGHNQISDITALAECPALEELRLNENSITDVTPLNALAKVKKLWLDENPIVVFPNVPGMVALEILNANGCGLVDISGLASLTALRSAWLDGNGISDVQPLAGLSNLVFIGLHGNQVEDVSPLASLSNLTQLDLENNRIRDFSALTGLTALEFLDLDENLISALPSVSGMTALDVLSLDHNLISYLEPPTGKTFFYLGLSHNRIRDLTPLLSLEKGRTIYLQQNPLSNAARTTQLPALRKLYNVGFSVADLEMAAELDFDWVYENTERSTQGRHGLVVRIEVTGDPYGNATYLPFVSAKEPDAVEIEPSDEDDFLWIVRGGPQGSAGVNELTVSVAGVEQGGVGAVVLPITVRRLGDVNGDGVVNASDKLEINKKLNGMATLAGIGLRELDLSGDGALVNAEDKLIVNQVLNGLTVP